MPHNIITDWKLCLRHAWAWRNFIVFITTPFLLLPLAVCHRDDKDLADPMKCAYVLAIMIAYWITEAIPLPITSLIPMILFPFLKLIDASSLASSYLDETNMAIAASILVVKAFEDALLHKRLAFTVIRVTGVQPRWLLAGLMVLSSLLSMTLTNAMAATLIIPIVSEIINELRHAVRETTEKEEIIARPPSSLSEFSSITTTTMGGDNVILSIEDSADAESRKKSTKRTMEMLNRYENMLVLSVAYSCSIGGTASMLGSAENLSIRNEITRQYTAVNCSNENPVNFASWLVWGLPGAVIFLPLAWFWVLIYYTGFRYAFGLETTPNYVTQNREQLYGVIRAMYVKLSPLTSRQWVVLGHYVVMIVLFFTRLLPTNPPTGWYMLAPGYVRESTVACLIAVSLFAFPISTSKEGKEKFRRPKNAIKWRQEDGGRPFNIVILIGGGKAASTVAITSGLAAVVSNSIFEIIQDMDESTTVICLVILSVFLIELTSNAAAVHFMSPVLAYLSIRQRRSPLLYLLPTSLTASFAFMLPVATPPNAIAFSLVKRLRVIDMVGIGFVMNLMGIGIVLLATNTWGGHYFDIYKPAWTDFSNGTFICHSIWDH